MRVFQAHSEMNLREIHFTGDVIFVHDPQPAGLVPRIERTRPRLALPALRAR
ncbi:MAG TPA: hypothetical protein VGS58_00745 [Candidatus Sulfopaludibacter sp.]|nr:hypothetical protein [Candidatus Sulfopaludibacter sp.]